MNTLVPDASNTRLDGVHQQAPRPLWRERTAVGFQSSTADAARQCRAVTHLYLCLVSFQGRGGVVAVLL